MKSRILVAVAIPFILSGMTACKQEATPDQSAEVQRLAAELAQARAELVRSQKDAAARVEDAGAAAADAAKALADDTAKRMQEKDARLRAAQVEITEMKRRDSWVYADASSAFQKGVTSTALDRYQQFLKDYPQSPLAVDAKRAIAELSTKNDKEARWRANLIDPKKEERELLQRIADGIATAEEVAPLLRRRTSAEVIKIMGGPSKTYRNGTELGYVDKVIDVKTGGKGTLILTLEEDRVVAVRLGYAGREIKP